MRSVCQWLAAALLLTGCGVAPGGSGVQSASPTGADSASVGSGAPAASESQIGSMTAAGARQFLASHPEALVLDVRNPDEWDDQYGHIEGARLIPLPELSARVAEIEGWKERPVMLVCRSGVRSQTAAEMLAGLGYRQVINLEGGMIAWQESAPKR